MPYLLDTNVAIHIRDRDPDILARLDDLGSPMAVSIMSLVELEAGVFRNPDLVAYRRAVLDRLISRITVIALDPAVVRQYGCIVHARGFSRTRVIDRLIAATAIVHDLTLVTINGADFRDIPDLMQEVWPASGTNPADQ